MVPFKYGGFWDVPRNILLVYRDRVFLLESYFNEEKDDYDENYTVSEFPTLSGQSFRAGKPWRDYNQKNLARSLSSTLCSTALDAKLSMLRYSTNFCHDVPED